MPANEAADNPLVPEEYVHEDYPKWIYPPTPGPAVLVHDSDERAQFPDYTEAPAA